MKKFQTFGRLGIIRAAVRKMQNRPLDQMETVKGRQNDMFLNNSDAK